MTNIQTISDCVKYVRGLTSIHITTDSIIQKLQSILDYTESVDQTFKEFLSQCAAYPNTENVFELWSSLLSMTQQTYQDFPDDLTSPDTAQEALDLLEESRRKIISLAHNIWSVHENVFNDADNPTEMRRQFHQFADQVWILRRSWSS